MAIELRQHHVRQIEEHGIEAYPYECCGALLGKEQDGRKVVTDILPLKNTRDNSPHLRFLVLPENPHHRFLVSPEDHLQCDREARRRGVDILGFYHSHPDHPARPSEYDRENAWPVYTYLILAVENGLPREMTGWLLSEDRAKFLSEEMTIAGDAAETNEGSVAPEG